MLLLTIINVVIFIEGTCLGPLSRNRKVGYRLAKGEVDYNYCYFNHNNNDNIIIITTI